MQSPPVGPGGTAVLLRHPVVRLLFGLLFVSLVLHALTLFSLLRLRGFVREEIGGLVQELDLARDDVIRIDLPVNETVPIRTDVAIDKQLTVPFSTTVKIDTQFEVPITTPFGTSSIPVPVKGDIPVSVDVPVNIQTTVPISTTVPLDLRFPIEIPLRETPLGNYLDKLRSVLVALSERL